MTYEPITIISAALSSLDFYSNTERTNELRSELIKLGHSFVGVSTVTNGNKLQSFMVTGEYSPALLELAKKFGQSSVLYSDKERNTIQTDKGYDIGKLYLTSKATAIKQTMYLTFVEDGKDYYFITGEKDVVTAAS